MCAPDMPEPPDPYETASAQMGQNVNTAIANAWLGNVNQNTPYGSLNYNQTGSYQMTDPNSGLVYDIPTFTATQTLTPEQQRLFDTGMGVKQNLADLAFSQSNRLNEHLNNPFDLGSLPARNDFTNLPQYNVNAPTFGPGPALQTGQNLSTAGGGGGPIMTSFGQTKFQLPTSLPSMPSFADLGTIQKSIQGVGSINPTFSGGGNVQTEFGDAGDITKTYGTDFSEDRRRVEEAIMSRLEPQIAADREALRTQLVNQGVDIGSGAYNEEQERFQRGVNDARMQTVLAGGQEQSRMVGLERDRSIFENSAQQQNYAQLADRARFANEGSALSFQQAQAKAMYELAAQGQGYSQAMGQAQLNNAGIAQDYGQRMGQAQLGQSLFDLGLRAQDQEYQQLFQRAQFNNAGQAQGWSQGRADIDAANAARQQMTQNANYAALTEYLNSVQAGQANFDNALRGFQTNYNTSLTTGQAQNAARAAALQEAFAVRNQPINEISALLGGAQVQNPSFVNTNMPTIPTVDQAALIQQDYQNRLAAAQAEYGAMNSMWGAGLGAGAKLLTTPLAGTMLSDRRAKKDVKKIGGIYEYTYKGDPSGQRRVGVMAQEVAKTHPNVVHMGRDGFRRVDYGALFGLAEAA